MNARTLPGGSFSPAFVSSCFHLVPCSLRRLARIHFAVAIEETPGQQCWCEAAISQRERGHQGILQ